MVGTSSKRPNGERVVDVEGGVVAPARDIKTAAEVAADVISESDRTRLANELADQTRDADTSLTRQRRDRDRATPRDAVGREEMSPRLQQDLPSPAEYRADPSPYQRRQRSKIKNEVMAAAPASQHAAIEELVAAEDPTRWRQVNAQLHAADGDAQLLEESDRRIVQRVDRAIQSYERRNDRDHRVYFAARMPRGFESIVTADDLPSTLKPGSAITFDQFTLAKHSLGEVPGHGTDDQQYVIFEAVTPRGLYLGGSDTVPDTTHLLPRGMDFEVVAADPAPFHSGTQLHDRLIVQLRERPPAARTAADDPWTADTAAPTATEKS